MFKHQYGFVENKGTTDACIKVINKIQSSIQSKNYVISIFYDFKKAFDTVDHHRLLFKLQKYGVRGCALNLFRSYLENRAQFVNIKGKNSESLSINYGVPQGSILGPILFNLYINDLHHFLHEIELTHYADDTTTLSANVNVYMAYRKAQECLNCFQNWASANYLTINTCKTKYLLFSPHNSECIVPPDLQLNDISLERQNAVRYLGLFIDDKLKYDSHVASLCSRLARAAGVAFAISNKLTMQAANSLYYSFTHSIISYLLLFWGSTFDSYLVRIQVIQNKIVRNLFANKITHNNTTELFRKLKILKVKDMYHWELGISIYKALYLNCYDPITESLTSLNWTHNYNTRKIHAFRLPQVRTNAHARHLIFAGVQFWNSLPLQVRTAKSLASFKFKLKCHLLKYYNPP